MTALNAYEIAYRAHFTSGGSTDVRPEHRDHDFGDCPAWLEEKGRTDRLARPSRDPSRSDSS